MNLPIIQCDDGTKGSHAHLTLKGSSARAGRSTVTSLLGLVSLRLFSLHTLHTASLVHTTMA